MSSIELPWCHSKAASITAVFLLMTTNVSFCQPFEAPVVSATVLRIDPAHRFAMPEPHAGRKLTHHRPSFATHSQQRSTFSQGSTSARSMSMRTQFQAENDPAETNENLSHGDTPEVVATSKGSNGSSYLLSLGTILFTLTAGAAKLGWLNNLPYHLDLQGRISNGDITQYTDYMIVQDLGVSVLCTALGFALVKIIVYATVDRNWLKPKDSRKMIHTLSAPLFMLLWPLYSMAPGARFFAAVIPALTAVRLYLASIGEAESSLARTVSRSGTASEAAQGPLVYVMMIWLMILVFWRDSAPGIVALSTLAAGDGMADLVGRRWGASNAWPGLTKKSVAGSAAFWISSTITASCLLAWMAHWDCLSLSAIKAPLIFSEFGWVGTVALITLAAGAVELIPGLDDNYSVTLTAAALSFLLMA